MIRFVVGRFNLDNSTTTTSAELSAFADALSEGGKYLVQVVSSSVLHYESVENEHKGGRIYPDPDLIVVFEVIDPEIADDPTTEGASNGTKH